MAMNAEISSQKKASDSCLLKIIVKTGSERAAEAVSICLEQMGLQCVAFEAGADSIFSTVTGYSDTPDRDAEILQDLHGRIRDLEHFDISIGDHSVECTILQNEDWATSWKKYFKPMRVGTSLVVSPSWEEVEVGEGDILIIMDPRNAFGTGQHPTTALCLRALERLDLKGRSVLDLGCGSGILTIAALKFGADVVAADYDPDCITVTTENLEINGVADRNTPVLSGNLAEPVAEHFPGRVFDFVVANILHHIVLAAAPQVKSLLASGGLFITSGIIDTAFDGFMSEMGKMGYVTREVCREAEWYQVTFALD
ncbi:MAG: 50S ribosomal protein L11 methyltransferase [Candidatus Wallbacteria bacterium HGW-Wallbacteria-1]|jgi:ribosomal protein L11 methyltransferase|uniref:Ribosomal protein L11 methyltransferase n=1 Tax=Candidatus Wallbacteria bacterium HGW-Wallbacteria-1 TaxID=2013854 RepID=A0A2N1PM31_9BACT|nr:MAG: 50S ribosomal protein L11 methyltransferase [Candidatus Wallbacteria bacterium HGW-Wallbacteria-1]